MSGGNPQLSAKKSNIKEAKINEKISIYYVSHGNVSVGSGRPCLCG